MKDGHLLQSTFEEEDGQHLAVLRIPSVRREDHGEYQCEASKFQRRRKRHQRRNGPTRPRSASRPAGAAGRLLLCGRRDGDTARHSGAPSATIRLSNIQWRKDSVSYLYIGTTRTLGTGQQLVSELSVADEDYLILTFLFNVPDMIRYIKNDTIFLYIL